MAERENIAALVLAGGQGRRMGGGKAQARLGRRRLLDYAIDAAHRHGRAVAIGVRRAEQAHADLAFVIDAACVEGPLASLLAGLAWARCIKAHFLLTLPCDAPFLPGDLSARLCNRLAHDDVMAALPRSAGRLHPACGLWRVEAAMAAPAFLATGRASLRGFAEHIGFAAEDWGAPAPDPFFNVNTPEDLNIADAWLAQPHLE